MKAENRKRMTRVAILLGSITFVILLVAIYKLMIAGRK